MVPEQQMRDLVGRPFPGGTFTIEPYLHWLTCDVVGSPPLPPGVAHPLFVYLATQSGIGLSLEELFALCHASSQDGPMLGEWGMEQRRPLLVAATYAVSGVITGVQRKEGRKTGIFDIVSFELRLAAEDGVVVAVARSSFLFPRRS